MKKQWLADLNAARAKHGHARAGKVSPTFVSWRAMIQRAHEGTTKDAHRYLGRGITVCREWLSFEAFLADMGERPAGKTLDRIDNTKGYNKDNCRWATPAEQASNKSTSRLLTAWGTTKTVAQWAVVLGTSRQALRHRLEAGWPAEKALSTPINRKKAQ